MNSQINSVLDPLVEPNLVSGQGTAMLALNAMVADIAPTDISVLLVGESGTGKEAYARLIHKMSRRHEAPLRKISCATLEPTRLLEQVQDVLKSGANGDHPACLFLDGVEELDLASQRALASVLPDGEPEPASTNKVRLISSTSINLSKAVEGGQFRRELYFRINGASLRLPPLRERKEDIPALIRHFLAKSGVGQLDSLALDSEAMEILTAYSWPGNIRELENLVRKMVALADTKAALSELRVVPRPARRTSGGAEPKTSSLKVAARAASRRTERELILKALERTHWNRKRAAQELQISYKSLLYKIKQIDVPGPGSEEL
jgi:two-component system, NtrC family, response regulator AtoC